MVWCTLYFMERETIFRVIPQADPDFIRSLDSLEVPPHVYPEFLEQLPRLHELFLRKKDAFAEGDMAGWMSVLQDEQALISSKTHV